MSFRFKIIYRKLHVYLYPVPGGHAVLGHWKEVNIQGRKDVGKVIDATNNVQLGGWI